MTSYTLRYTGKRAAAAAYLPLLAQGKVGETLVRNGFSKDSFCAFLAGLASLMVDNDFTEGEMAELFGALDAGNSSAASQACGEIEILVDGSETAKSLSAFWSKATPTKSAPSLLSKLNLNPKSETEESNS